ncbi:ketoacyl-synt-domain-containing protein [Tilletiaria anomala UBC 951]|uniref:Ketoacyl-synt-domain-containing protein n=1 Tax=Tilletiaria anomala (strain ATCC 24038 / CBS 436.72 / UBC 951) TaxID=1037660 RepID=A0A066W8Y0_TILAU|nr:ketoacyl-synt-domain-containing protein [Tilletiaria anomala UBC 951]KDN50402.1 ketoacyl-synt-domain-containing protein [Tilletiaria anomala UBC 951]
MSSASRARSIFIFGSQGPANFAEHLLSLVKRGQTNPHLTAFFQLVLDAIRTEVLSITDTADLAVLPDISKFASLKTLCLFHESTGYQNATVNGILLVVLQAAQVIARLESEAHAFFDSTTQFAGFCTGAVTASALAAAVDGPWDVIRQSIEAVRLVFWISLCSSQVAREHISATGVEDSLPWSYAVSLTNSGTAAVTVHDIEAAIDSFNNAVCADEAQQVKIVATAYAISGVSVGGPPARLQTFADWINAKDAGISARAAPLRIFSPYHNEALLSASVEAVMNHARRREIKILGAGDIVRKLARPVYDVVRGTVLDASNFNDTALIRLLVESNFTKCNRFDLVADSIASSFEKEHGPVTVSCAAPSLGLGTSIVELIKAKNPALEVATEDLSSSTARFTANSDEDADFASPENESIAIVAMSCRLPGAIMDPDQFWDFLRAGKTAVGEIPKHLFDIDDYYGDGINQTRVRHMHALPEDVVKTMDLRIPNISPKEAEQMDPQHRLAILCAYEALERAGYSPMASQSFDNRRVAYFAAVTSDDYRENAMSAPTGISSYFISGCIRAFVPGALSFALALEGPSNTIDSGETSSLVTLEHARHALLAKQCDVALAGGFSVLTAPLNFIGMDVDNLLAHSDRNTTFDADHKGVVRGDGAVVFVLKRLSDAIAEGDEVLATLPAVSHRTFADGMSAAEQASFLRSVLASSGVPKQSIVHVEAAGYFNAEVEAAEFDALHATLGPEPMEERTLTVGSVRPNLGASEAAMGMVEVMKAVLMLKHEIIPGCIAVDRLNPTIKTIADSGKTIIPFSECQMRLPSNQPATIAVHGLALAGNQAVALVQGPRKLVMAEDSSDTRGCHIFSLSAKSSEAAEQMRNRLNAYVTEDTNLLRLSYTLMARRLLHPFRITFTASTRKELKAKLGSTAVLEVREQTKRLQLEIVFTESITPETVQALCNGDCNFRDASEASSQVLISLGMAQRIKPELKSIVAGIRSNLALLPMLQAWGINASRVIAEGRAILVALVASRVLSVPEALFLACLLRHPATAEKALRKMSSRVFSVDVVVSGSKSISAGATLSSAIDIVMRQLFQTSECVVEVAEQPPSDQFYTLSLGEGRNVWTTIATCLANLHSSAYPIRWTGYFATFLPGLRYLSDLPSYPFSLTRHWIQYTDRNLIRPSEGSPQSIVMEEIPEDRSDEKSLPLPVFPMLGKLLQYVAHTHSSSGQCSATYEAPVFAQPMISFIEGHLVNGVALAPATLWADLCLEAAVDASQKSGAWDEDKLQPALKQLEIIRPLTITKSAADPHVLLIKLLGNFFEGSMDITISSRGQTATEVKHMSAKVQMAPRQSIQSSWMRFSSLIASRYQTVRESSEANIIGSKLAYSAFETVVAYKEGSGFRGIQSVAILDNSFEAATIVKMSPDAPKSLYIVNPCFIDSLGQITGFICNSTCDSKHVYLADGVAAMRFSHQLVKAADAGETLHAYCRMIPHDNGAYFLGDAFFLDASLSIVGEMEGVRYKKLPRAVLQLLLPNSSKPRATQEPQRSTIPALNGPAPQNIGSTRVPRMDSKVDRVLASILDAVAIELGVEVAQLRPTTSFADLGLDSLMAIVILGSLTNLPVELPPSLFLDCLTPEDVKSWLSARLESSAMQSTETSEDPQEAQGAHSDRPAAGKAQNALDKTRQVVATELGILEEELEEETDLAELGLDSLMSLLVLGTLNAELGMELPPGLFIDCTNLKELRHYFVRTMGEDAPAVQSQTVPASVAITQQALDAATVANLLKDVRVQQAVLLQKCDHGPNLFLFPDGSGAAAAYASMPKLGTCSLYGLNSPFMSDSSLWKGGVQQLALAYLSSIRMVQPRGPYFLGGWSFGGVAAFEACRILSASQDPADRVELLLLLDSPSPSRFPPLPMSIVDWIFSSADIPTPPTLSKRLVSHFQATVDSLERLGVPEPLTANQPQRVVLLTARHGLNVKKEIPEENKTVKWLVEPRVGLGPNGWDVLLPNKTVLVNEFDANHFTMMHEPFVQQLAALIANACKG